MDKRSRNKPINRALDGEQGWRSGESARLPPMCPGFDSRTRRHMWAEFVGSLLCSARLDRSFHEKYLSEVSIILEKLAKILENLYC